VQKVEKDEMVENLGAAAGNVTVTMFRYCCTGATPLA